MFQSLQKAARPRSRYSPNRCRSENLRARCNNCRRVSPPGINPPAPPQHFSLLSDKPRRPPVHRIVYRQGPTNLILRTPEEETDLPLPKIRSVAFLYKTPRSEEHTSELQSQSNLVF